MASTFDNKLPTFSDAVVRAGVRGVENAQTAQRNWLAAGVSASIDKFQGASGTGLRAVGDLLGSRTISDIGAGIAARNKVEAAQNGRPDLESFPTDDWSKIPAWAGYQIASQLPTIALTAAAARFGGKYAARYAPEVAVDMAAAAPRWLGGGGLRAGMTAAEQAIAQQRGARMAAGVLAQAPINYPQAVGSLYEGAVESGNEGPGAAALALIGGVPYSLMEGFEPPTLGKALERGMEKGILKRVATGAAVNAAQETVTEGVQTAMEQAFRPDLPIRERLANVVEGALTGGFVGGVFGGAAGAVGGVRSLKTVDPAQASTDDLKTSVDNDLKLKPGPTVDPQALSTDQSGQVGMADTGQKGEARPFANLKDDELVRRLEVVQRQMSEMPSKEVHTAQQDFADLFGEAPPLSTPNPAASLMLQQLRREMDIRQGVPVEEPAPDPTAGAGVNITNFPVTPDGEDFERTVEGPFRSEPTFTPPQRVNELDAINERINGGTATAQDFARARMLTEGEVKVDTSANTGTGDRANAGPNDLFRNQNIALTEQLTPDEVKRRAAQRTPEERAAREQVAGEFFGDTKAQWAQDAKNGDWNDELDLAATVLEEIDRRDAANRALPASLKKKAVELGLMTEDGAPRDLRAELQAADAKNNELTQAARDEGTQQALAKAARFQKNVLKPLIAQVEQLDAIKQRFAERQSAAPAQQTAIQEAPSPETLLGITPGNVSEADAQALAAAPPAPVTPTFQQQFANRRSVTQMPGKAIPVVEPEVEAAPQPTGPVRDASGNRYETLGDRFRNRGDTRKAAPDISAVAPVRGSPLARGTSFAVNGIAVNPETEMQVVTAKDKVQPRRRTRKRVDITPPLIPASPLAIGNNVGSTNAQLAAQIAERADRTQKRLQAVVNDASLDEIGRQDLRQAAAEAKTEADATRVLAEYTRATGAVFSQRAGDQRLPPLSPETLNKALEKIARSLPQAARDAIIMVKTADDLPDVVKAVMQMQDMHPTDVRGVLHDGKVYVVEDQIGSEAELKEVIDHELFGHGGVRALLGRSGNKVLLATWSRMGGLPGLMSLARKFNVEKALAKYLPDADPKTGLPTRELTAGEQIGLVDELLAQVQGSSGRFSTMLRAWAGQFKKLLLDTLRGIGLDTLASRLDTFGPSELAMTLSNMRKAVQSGASLRGDGTVFLRVTPQGMNESLQNISKTADNVWSWVDQTQQRAAQSEFRLTLNRFHLKTSTISHIVSLFGDMFTRTVNGKVVNPLKQIWDAHVMRGVAEQRVAHAVAGSYTKFESVLRAYPKAEEHLSNLMRNTFDMIDPRKTWADHLWLHDAKDPANNAHQKAKVDAANKLYRSLSEPNNVDGNKVIEVYHSLIDTNEGTHFAQQAMSLFNLMTNDKEIVQSLKDEMSTRGNPMDKYLQNTEAYNDTKTSRDFWEAETKWLVGKAEQYLKTQSELSNRVDETSSEKIEKNTSALKSRLRSIASEQAAMKQAPYFHLGRFGDWVLTFPVRLKDGKADPVAMEAIAKKFQSAGIVGVEIPTDATRGNAFIRFESKHERDAAQKVAHELAAEGYIIHNDDKKINAFNRSDDKAMGAYDLSAMPQWAQGLMDKIRAKEFGKTEGLTDEEKRIVNRLNNEFERHVEQYFLELLPDTSVTKVMVQRNNVPGFSSDMMRSHFFRAQIAGRALANLYAAGRMAEARAGLLAVAHEARSDLDTTKSQMKQNIVSELFLRESQRPHMEKNTWVDVARALNHAYFLGMTPAYPVVNLTQIGVLLWPELSKKHGFVNSAKAIAKVTPTALKVLGAVWKEAFKGGLKNLPDASINAQVLQAAGLTGSQANFIMRIVNSGILDIGSQSREIGRIAEGQRFSKMDAGLRWAASFGYYSEMLSRLVAALSARELHGGYDEEMYQYVDDTVRQSMLSYETWNQARATGRMGLLGEYTPIMTSLMQYTFQLTEKLYREFHSGFMNSSLSAKEKSEARAFLGTHLAAIVTLTGTLGMPMASAFAGVFDLLANTLWKDKDDEPLDVRRAYRNWLTNVFGDAAGDMIARGVPRAIGVDLSARAGEQDLLPYAHMFSKLLTDKREWKDKVAEDTFRALGAPLSMANNIVAGGSQMMNGNYMDGLIEMMPPAIKGPMKAYKMWDKGYTDQKGNKIPIMTPGAIDIIAQALGFNPAQNAEYQESKNDQRILRGQMTNKAQQIRENIAVAIENGDMDSARTYIRQAQEFDAKNPQFRIMPTIQSVLRSRARERAQSLQTGAPLGTKTGLADRAAYGISN